MLKIGLTGGIGSGKSTVARIFENLNVKIYYADEKAKTLMESDNELISSIKKLLGPESYVSDKRNTKWISSKIFSDKSLLNKLNEIVHPAVRKDFQKWCEYHKTEKYIIEEAALLFETGFHREFDYTILVVADEELRIKRVMERDGVGKDMVENRIINQLPEDEKVKLCDFRIENNELDLLVPQVLDLHNKFVSLQKL